MILTNIIENILKVGYFPQAWKTASVIPILEPGPARSQSARMLMIPRYAQKATRVLALITNSLHKHLAKLEE
ncbi:hypothetical protein TNCV_2946921 [Trichonephila clavipes]|nr:hypothetical protein TNCV_2946921 [Trichonephila clavipes]